MTAVGALFVHVAFLAILPASLRRNQSSDFPAFYKPVAENLLAGKGLTLASKPALAYPPGLPMIYAATFRISDLTGCGREWGLRLLQAVFVMTSAMLVALVALKVFGLRVALVSAMVWSTHPFHIWLTKQPDSSALITTLLLLGVLLFLAWLDDGRQSILYGLSLGGILAVASLIKPFTIALPIVFVALAFVSVVECRRRARALLSLTIVVTYVLFLTPWEVWAHHATGHWIPLCTNGPNALIDGITFGTVRGLKPVMMPHDVAVLTQDAITHYKQLKTTASIMSFLGQQAKENPRALLELFLLKAGRSWYDSETRSHEGMVAAIQLVYLMLVMVGVRAGWKEDHAQRNFVLVATGVLLYFWAMIALTALPLLRYMVPSISLLMVFVGVGLELCLRRFGGGGVSSNPPVATPARADA